MHGTGFHSEYFGDVTVLHNGDFSGMARVMFTDPSRPQAEQKVSVEIPAEAFLKIGRNAVIQDAIAALENLTC